MNKYQAMRAEEVLRHTMNRAHDQGADGRIFELTCASENSRKVRVSKQGEADVYINLGRVWEQFNHNTPLSIFFQVTNPDHKTGDIFIDNVKIIAI